MNPKQRRNGADKHPERSQDMRLAEAIALHRAGRPAEAEARYRAILRDDPRQADALHLLGVLALQSGQPMDAVALISQAIAIAPRVPDYHDNLGSALATAGQPAEAVAAHGAALALRPDAASFWYNLGNARETLGQYEAAAEACRQAIALQPGYAKAHFNLGNALRAQERLVEAVRAYRQAATLAPGQAQAWSGLGAVLQGLDRPAEAAEAYRQALALRPDRVKAHLNLGTALQVQGALAAAVDAYRQALALSPDDAGVLANLGSALHGLGRPAEAEACLRRALGRQPDLAEAVANLGQVLQGRGALAEAEACFDRALSLDPCLATAHFNRGLVRLARGDLARGWPDHEARFKAGQVRARHRPEPAWTGEDLTGKTILVWREQGIGDELMFGTGYADLIARAGHVVIECDPRLVGLFARSFPTATVRAEGAADSGPDSGPAIDFHTAAGSLPQFLRPDRAAFDRQPAGYLVPDPERVAFWRGRLAALGGGPKVGIGWRSRHGRPDPHGAYTRLSQWGAVLGVSGVTFVNLQYDRSEDEIAEAERLFGVPIAHWPDLDRMNDLEGVAALVAALDLVITGPMAVGELAGALGVPVWRLHRTGDWLALGCAHRPWFPSMRLLYARPGETLDAMLDRAGHALRAAVADGVPLGRAVLPSPSSLSSPPPDAVDIEARLTAAIDHHRAGRLSEAEAGYRAVLDHDPKHADALHLLGVLAHQAGRPEAALDLIGRALAVEPDFAQAHNNLGLVHQALGRMDAAVAHGRQAVALKPDYAEAYTNLGSALKELGRLGAAETCHRRALTLRPDYAEARTNLGSVLENRGEVAAAEDCHRQALALNPDLPDIHNNLGTALQAQGRRDEAEACFTEALALNPNFALARWNRGLLRLARGDLAGGWADYDWRFRGRQLLHWRSLPAPLWQGEDPAGKRILVWREQGIGDELMFASTYPDLIARAGHVIIECSPRLVALFARSFPTATVRPPSVDNRGRETLDPSALDAHIPAGSLPRLLRPEIDAFLRHPAPTHAGYLVPDPERVAIWRDRLAALGPGLKVGIGWRSGVVTASRRLFYTTLDQWAPVFAVPGLVFVNLQYGSCEDEIIAAERRFGIRIARWPDLDLMNDLDGAAALTAALDLVITAPTSVGEMAGALGVPVWRFALGQDWSTLGAEGRPWFPSMRLFYNRHAPDLDPMLAAIARALRPGPGPEPAPSALDTLEGIEAALTAAVALHQTGCHGRAELLYRRVLRADPRQPVALHLLGLLAHQTGRPRTGADLIAAAVAQAPGYVAALVNLGNALQACGRPGEAEAAYRRALALKPDAAEALTNLGNAFAARERFDVAAVCHRQAIALAPAMVEAHAGLGLALWRLQRLDRAEVILRRALALRPEAPDLHANLGVVLRALGRSEEAAESQWQALRLNPNHAEAYGNLGLIYLYQGARPEAAECLARALALDPDLASAHLTWSHLRLWSDLAEGWREYEWRFAAAGRRGRRLAVPAWQGGGIARRRILVWREQGIGDELMFGTCYADLIARAGHVVIECDPRLVGLFARSFPAATVRAETVDPSDIDLHVAAGSLPRFLRPDRAAFDRQPAGYLVPDPERAALWRDRLAALGPGPKIGLCWRSSLSTPDRRAGYSRLEQWAPVFAVPGLVFVNLQYDRCEEEIIDAERRFGVSIARWPDLDLFQDLEGAAALTAGLDQVITAPTSVGEMAGALGVPVWRFFAGHDWTTFGSGRRPWFPSMRIFRARAGQTIGDTLHDIAAALTAGAVGEFRRP